MTETKQKFYVTFGQVSPARDGVVEVTAPSETDVRLYANYDGKAELANWCSVYSEKQWADPEYSQFYPLGVLRRLEIGVQPR